MYPTALWLAGWLLMLQPTPGKLTIPPVSELLNRAKPNRAVEKRVAPDRIVYRAHADVPVTYGATAAWIIAEVEKARLVPLNCKWCDRRSDGSSSLNGIDSWGRRAFLWHHTGRAITFSNITGFMLAPAAAYGLDWMAASHDGRKFDAPVDIILITESMAIASDVTEALKFAIGRQRPFVHVLAPGARASTPDSADNNTSFPSGHATLAFALATSSSEIAALRGYSRAAWLFRVGMPVATLTAYFRVAADRHYLTDVLAGATVGSAVGYGVPYLTHRSKSHQKIPRLSVVPTRGGELVAAQWVW